MGGTLYVVSTPIGNLEDVTLRALRILKEVDLIAAEDTRVTRKLLSHYDIHTPLTSFHEHTRGEKAASLVARMLAGESVALVSDAGTPLISDPGSDLVDSAIQSGIAVFPIPGASAVMAALVASGLPAARFCFDGFPPRPKSDRREFFNTLRSERRTIILYESPSRLTDTLEDLYKILGNRTVAVTREITKKFEEVFRGSLSSAITHFHENKPRGEFTIVIYGAAIEPPSTPDVVSIEAALRSELDSGRSSRDAIEAVSTSLGLPRKVVYRTCLELTRNEIPESRNAEKR